MSTATISITPENDVDHITYNNGMSSTQEQIDSDGEVCKEHNCSKSSNITKHEISCQTDISAENCEIKEKTQQFGPKTFQEKCIDTLLNVTLITKLVSMLSNAGCLENFVQLVTHITEGTMSYMNIAFLLCLDVVKLHSCITKTAMRFCRETKQFWEVVYKVCKGKGLHLFSGSKNRGCLQSKTMYRGSYDPAYSNHNFAVLDVKSLIYLIWYSHEYLRVPSRC